MELPQLPREPIRPEREQPDADKEIWQPHWQCFCCHDSGIIVQLLVLLVIPEYDHHHDKPVACQHPRCEAGKHLRGDPNYDQRFTAGTCDSLDSRSRKDWRKTVQAASERIQETTKALAKEKSLRVRDRSPDEDRLIADRHRLVVEEDWGWEKS